VILTHICDKACPFCSDLYRIYCPVVNDETKSVVSQFAMSINTLNDIIPKLLKEEIIRVTLVGGEATLNPDFVEICKLLHQHFEVVCTSAMFDLNKIIDASNYVDHWNFSVYRNNLDLSFTNKLKGTVTLSKLLFDGDSIITNMDDLDKYIDKYGDKYQLKFSTLRGVNRFSVEREYVSWLEESHKLEKVMIFNNEVYSYKYRGYYIDRKNVEPIYSKEKLPTSLKVHPNGIIDYTWDEPWNKSYN